MNRAASVPFDQLCRAAGLPRPVAEYRFALHRGRRWRFDWAWPGSRVALEIDGGVWTRGRHVRSGGYLADMEKLNAAVDEGWFVIRCTPTNVDQILDTVRSVLARRASRTP